MLAPWKKSYDKPTQHIKNQRYHFADKCLYSQSNSFSSSHVGMWDLNQKILSTKEFILLICGAGEDSWESFELQGDQTSQSLNIHWKDWWSWSSNTLATCFKEWVTGKDPDAGKDWRPKEKGVAEDEMVG